IQPRHFPVALVVALALATLPGSLTALELSGSQSTSRAFAIQITAPSELLQHYTIGVYDTSKMTAQPGDPDFLLQALQADNVAILNEYGKPAGDQPFSMTVDGTAELGVFFLREASLRDFSRGANPYR